MPYQNPFRLRQPEGGQHRRRLRLSGLVKQNLDARTAESSLHRFPRLATAVLHPPERLGIEGRKHPQDFHHASADCSLHSAAIRSTAPDSTAFLCCIRSRYLFAAKATTRLATALVVTSIIDPPTCRRLIPGRYHSTKPCRSALA